MNVENIICPMSIQIRVEQCTILRTYFIIVGEIAYMIDIVYTVWKYMKSEIKKNVGIGGAEEKTKQEC